MRSVRARSFGLLLAAGILCAFSFTKTHAGATRLVLLASAGQTATANGAAFSVPSLTQCAVFVDVTTVTGTTPTMQVWLQSSSDGATTWFDLPYVARMTDNSGSATEGSGGAQPSAGAVGGRNINGTTNITAASKYAATYSIFSDYIRVRWFIGGTTPNFTFSVRAVCK